MIIRKRRAFILLLIVIWLLGILYFTSDSGFLKGDPPKVSGKLAECLSLQHECLKYKLKTYFHLIKVIRLRLFN